MLKKQKHRITAVGLTIAIMATMIVGYVSATEPLPSERAAGYYDFWLSCPGAGGSDTASVRVKERVLDSAFYNLTTVTNTTGYNAYINVRGSDKVTKVGNAESVSKTGVYYVDYLSGYGNVGDSYCPSGQSSSSSTTAKAVYIEGSWAP